MSDERDVFITITLGEILRRCNSWEHFCGDEGFSVYAVNEGGGDVRITLPEWKAIKYNIIGERK